MGALDFRNAYEFDPETYPGEGGLPGMLRAFMQRQDQREGANFAPTLQDASANGQDRNDIPPGGLLGRLLALQAEQSGNQLIPDGEQPPSAPRDPNFRRLARVVNDAWPPDAGGSSNFPPRPLYSPVGDAPPGAPPQDAGTVGSYGNKPVGLWTAPPPAVTTARVGWRGIGIPLPGPMPPGGPGVLPQIPMPAIPDSWKATWAMLQLYPRILAGIAGGEDDGSDCKEERRNAREVCADAFANGWKSDHDVGPYRTSSGKPWSIEDCMRGFISERCGGNATNR